MGLFSFLFDKPVIIEDDVFGSLQLITPNKDKAQGDSYFEAKSILFSPINQSISGIIEADLTGPAPAQRSFFKHIEENYTALIKTTIPFIEDEFQNWKPDFKVKDFAVEFHLVHVTIPRLDTTLVQWEWAFETIHDANHTLTIYMLDDKAQGILFDG